MQVDLKELEAARSSRPPSTDGSEPEFDPRVRDAETVDKKPSSEQDPITKGESSTCQPPCAQEEDDIPGTSGAAPPSNVDNDDMETLLRKKINEGGLGNMTVPEMHMSGCSDCEETPSEEADDDLCSTSSDDTDDSYNFLPSGVLPPVLPVCLIFFVILFFLYSSYTAGHFLTRGLKPPPFEAPLRI